MSAPASRAAGQPARWRVIPSSTRAGNEVLLGAAAVVALVMIALGITTRAATPNFALALGVAAGAVAVATLVCSPRLELTVAFLALYLGLLDGPVKLGSGGHEAAAVVRDVLIFAVVLGAVLRLLVGRERVRLPPLSGWVLAFVALVLVETFNPNTHGLVKALGGYRQQLEFVPFFFFGYLLMRSKERFRKFFLLLGAIALANGLISTYQTKISPAQLASWGPGYHELVYGTVSEGSGGVAKGISGRQYVSEGVAKVRPPGLGKDAGFGGAVGLIALPGALALLATGNRRRRWLYMLLCLGALLAVVTGLGRLQVVGAAFALLAFALLSASAGRRVTRPLGALLAVAVLAVPLGAVLISAEAPGTFSRYGEIAPANAASANDKKTGELSKLPHQLLVAPFGVGLSSAGAATGFGGRVTEELEGHAVGGETQYNFEGDELGVPGIVIWVGLLLTMIVLAVTRLRQIADIELRIDLAAVFAVPAAFLVMGISGPVMGSAAAGPFFWFAAGVAAYWLAGPGRVAAARVPAAAVAPGAAGAARATARA